jgi:glutamate-1-semialdehyde 2,1-aminomutase
MSNRTISGQLFTRALDLIPGGVNSPVRAFKAVGGNPVFIASASGPYLFDEDGNRYIDLINSWGPMIHGHAHPEVMEAIRAATARSFSFGAPTRKEIEMAEIIIEMVPSIEKVRMVNSGTEATMSAIRLARGFTGRDKIIKFEGCYHGHGDSFLISAGSGAATFGNPDSPGVTQGTARDTLTAPFNDLAAVEHLIEQNKDNIAAIITEPVVGNMGCVLPREGFLEGLRRLCDVHGIVLIFDEVMTGFRLAPGGAQELLGIMPDLCTLGKIIGGGLPVGAYGGKKEIMDWVSPSGPVYQAGTLSGNPVAMAAGYTALNLLRQNPEVYSVLESVGARIESGYASSAKKYGKSLAINRAGSMFSLFFTEQPVVDFNSAKTSDTALFAQYFNIMLQQGIYIAPSQFEALFISASITDEIADTIVEANDRALAQVLG